MERNSVLGLGVYHYGESMANSYLPGSARMKWPNNVKAGQETIGPLGKAGLFWVSLVILLILPVLSLLNFVLRGLLAFNIHDLISFPVRRRCKTLQQENELARDPYRI